MRAKEEESRRQVAERVAARFTFTRYDRQALANVIEAALKDRDERAAKIAETTKLIAMNHHSTAQKIQKCRDGIAAAIRNEDTK